MTPGGAGRFAASFLRDPDLFPARAAGETFGAANVDLDLVGGPYRIQGLSELQETSLAERFPTRRFRRPVDPVLTVRVFGIDPAEFNASAGLAQRAPMDLDHHPGRIRVVASDFLGLVDLAGDGGSDCAPVAAALWTHRERGLGANGTLENFLRVILAYRLLALGGLLLHSAAVHHRGFAHVFLGPSGAGKSTLSRLADEAGAGVLSDDVNTLVPCQHEDRLPTVEQLPFAGDFGAERTLEGTFQVAGIYRLEKAAKHRLVPMSPARATATLVASAPFVNVDPLRLDVLLRVASTLVRGLPAHTLEFRRDAGFLDLLPAAHAAPDAPDAHDAPDAPDAPSS